LHLQIDSLEVTIVIVASIILTLLFDLPMQEVRNVIMESTDSLTLETSKKKTNASENKKTEQSVKSAKSVNVTSDQTNSIFEDNEVDSTGWDWQKDNIIHGAIILEEHDIEEEIMDMSTLNKMNGKRMSFIDHETHEESNNQDKIVSRKLSKDTKDYIEHRRSMNNQSIDDSEEEVIEFLKNQHDVMTQHNRRFLSRTKEKRPTKGIEDEEDWQHQRKDENDSRQFRRLESRGRTLANEADDYPSWEFVRNENAIITEQYDATLRQIKSSSIRSVDVTKSTFSSESEEELSSEQKFKPERLSSSDAKANDEEEWERDLRIRRKQFMEKLIAQQRELLIETDNREDNAESLKRRSSAEGRIALLRDDLSGEDNMDSWTVSVGPRITLLGSSQEPSEPEEDGIYMRRREYREQGPPSREESEEESQDTSRRQSYTSGSQKTSLEEEDDVNIYNFILTKESKRESLQDLSKLLPEELANSGWNVVKKEDDLLAKPISVGLFKRESIVKSQASEEDPEYLLPERPKLIQQEREHPFKKAWQMQKSKSEEEGSSAYSIKEPKEQQYEIKSKEQDHRSQITHERNGEQSEDIQSFADEEVEAIMLQSRNTDIEDKISSKSSTDFDADSISTEHSRATYEGDHRQNSKSETDEDSAKFNWPDEEEENEIYKTSHRKKSEEADWDWEQEET